MFYASSVIFSDKSWAGYFVRQILAVFDEDPYFEKRDSNLVATLLNRFDQYKKTSFFYIHITNTGFKDIGVVHHKLYRRCLYF